MDDGTKSKILSGVAEYYSAKIRRYGAQPLGVDWNGEESQKLRFEQLVRIIDEKVDFSINDLGCGYGALYDFLCHSFKRFDYYGCDISESMISVASRNHRHCPNANFAVSSFPLQVSDYSVASGIFNVRMEVSDEQWLEYMLETIEVLDRASRLGFAFNCLTSYSDQDKMKDYLYYADPCALFDHCKARYSRNVALMHDYDLYEFTMIVRKKV